MSPRESILSFKIKYGVTCEFFAGALYEVVAMSL